MRAPFWNDPIWLNCISLPHCNCVELSRLSGVKCTYSVNGRLTGKAFLHECCAYNVLSLNQYLCADPLWLNWKLEGFINAHHPNRPRSLVKTNHPRILTPRLGTHTRLPPNTLCGKTHHTYHKSQHHHHHPHKHTALTTKARHQGLVCAKCSSMNSLVPSSYLVNHYI